LLWQSLIKSFYAISFQVMHIDSLVDGLLLVVQACWLVGWLAGCVCGWLACYVC
jgi:hypothetical protein